MAFGTGDILQTLQQGVQGINNLATQIKTTFPQVSATSTSVTAGTIVFTSSEAALFLTVITSSGGTYKVPLYLP
jgi:hypothetical protein